MAELLRPGRAGSNTAADHVVVLDAALAQLLERPRMRDEHGRVPVLVRTDAAGFVAHLARLGIKFSVGARFAYPAPGEHGAQIEQRNGAWVAEATTPVDLPACPAGTRLILRKKHPHPGAQLRTTDIDGPRVTGLLNTTPTGRGVS